MPLPEPTANLLVRMRQVAILLDTVAANCDPDTAKYKRVAEHANTVWSATRRLEEFARLVEDIAPITHVRLRITDATGDRDEDYDATPRPVRRGL